MLIKLLFVVAAIFFFIMLSAQFTPPPTDQNGPPQFCLKSSMIDTSSSYVCQSGPNRGVTYYKIASDIAIGKKEYHVGEYPAGLLPKSCEGVIDTSGNSQLVNRAIQPSTKCTDDKVYEIWAGNVCQRYINNVVSSPNYSPTSTSDFCGNADDYEGCFNSPGQEFILLLKDGAFQKDQENTFDLYIRSGNSIPLFCGSVGYSLYVNAVGSNPPDNKQIQCLQDLRTQIQCN